MRIEDFIVSPPPKRENRPLSLLFFRIKRVVVLLNSLLRTQDVRALLRVWADNPLSLSHARTACPPKGSYGKEGKGAEGGVY